MHFALLPLEAEDLADFKRDMQEAFRLGAAAEFPEDDEEVLPEEDIDRSLRAKGSTAWKALVHGRMVGGAIVVVDADGKTGHLDFLYVKHGVQSRGLGQRIWQTLEEKYPEVELWETVTPYFDKRNLHFYINRCGFAAVEFYNPHHSDPHAPDAAGLDYMFRFEKKIQRD